MKKDEVIEKYCELSAEVATKVFEYAHAADCFCGRTNFASAWNYQYEDAVLNYIREAVHEKMKRDQHI